MNGDFSLVPKLLSILERKSTLAEKSGVTGKFKDILERSYRVEQVIPSVELRANLLSGRLTTKKGQKTAISLSFLVVMESGF